MIMNSWPQTYIMMEDERIRNHLRNTEITMREKDCSHLTDELKKSREDKIKLLHEYWVRGNYPLNTGFPQERLPFIKDEFDTPCAMAYIIEESGNKELAKLLHKQNNNIFIKDVNDGPLIDWINESGITKEEACQIQPTYGYRQCKDKNGKIINYTSLSPKPPDCFEDIIAPPRPPRDPNNPCSGNVITRECEDYLNKNRQQNQIHLIPKLSLSKPKTKYQIRLERMSARTQARRKARYGSLY